MIVCICRNISEKQLLSENMDNKTVCDILNKYDGNSFDCCYKCVPEIKKYMRGDKNAKVDSRCDSCNGRRHGSNENCSGCKE